MAEIESIPRYAVKCRDCGYEDEVGSVYEASQTAREHINREDLSTDYPAYPNYYHVVELKSIHLVGRNL